MPDGGKLTIETANCYLDEVYVADITEPVEAGQYVMTAVTDTGLGMDKVALQKAFEPFFTTKAVGKGTGLGLSQVYGFVRQSSGHIRIYSEIGEGTTVKIYLPRYVGEGEQTGARLPPGASPRSLGDEVILVVEDDNALRAYTVQILAVVMPGGLNGRQLADEAQSLRPDLRVLFTTGYTRNAIVHHGGLDPGVNLIGKPFSFEGLAAKIRSILDEK
jgi:CheY-like chemotaxis protein